MQERKINMNEENVNLIKKDYGYKAFLPTVIFLAIYLGCGIFFTALGMGNTAFKQVPRLFAMLVGMFVCMMMGGKARSYEHRMATFCKGASNTGVMTMIMIYFLAGAFSGISKGMGAVTSTANLGLSLMPTEFVFAGIFIISAFLSTAMGTSMGVLAAVGPIAVAMAEASGASLAIGFASCIGGAMFGDNLSMISDLTIASMQSTGCTARDKFKLNAQISIIAGILTIIVLCMIGTSGHIDKVLDYQVIKVVPYLFILVVALTGCNVFFLLMCGIILAIGIGFGTNSFTLAKMAQSAVAGMLDMGELIAASLLIKGITAVVDDLGGIRWLVQSLTSKVKTRIGAEYTLAAMASVFDMALANNTITTLMAGELCRSIVAKHNIAPRRVATIITVFACIFQGNIPHGAQILLAITFTGASPFDVILTNFYLMFLLVVMVIYIQFKLGWTKEEKENIALYDENMQVKV